MSYDRQMKQVQEVGIWWFLTRTGDSAFLWGSPQVLFQRFQQPTVPARGESLYDSDSEGEITKSSPLRLKSTHSSLDFLSPWFVDFPMGWSFDPTCVELPGKTFFGAPGDKVRLLGQASRFWSGLLPRDASMRRSHPPDPAGHIHRKGRWPRWPAQWGSLSERQSHPKLGPRSERPQMSGGVFRNWPPGPVRPGRIWLLWTHKKLVS